MRRGTSIGPVAVLCCGLMAGNARADDLRQLIDDMLRGNDRLAAATSDTESARNTMEYTRGGWYPTLTSTINYGYEKQNKPSGSLDTQAYRNQYTASLKQLLWDFGAVNASINASEASHKRTEAQQEVVRQGLILDGVTAYANLVKNLQQMDYARESVTNIRRQTGLEEAKVALGSGLSSDVLQAKRQLAGADASRVKAEIDLGKAQNAFRYVFNKAMADAKTMRMPRVPLDLMPASHDDALKAARANSPAIKAAGHTVEYYRQQMEGTRAQAFFPKIELVGEANDKRNISGTMGAQQELLAKVEVSMPFNLGFTAINSLKAAESSLAAYDRRLSDTRDLLEKDVGNAWEDYILSKERAASLRNEAVLANEFLELARKERQLGNRSLIDVLAGETALINAQSQAASAEADVVIAAYTVLAVIGSLDPGFIR